MRSTVRTGAVKGLREVRIAGRGGAGVVTAGELLGRAAVREGRHAQAIPAFGPERRGALCTCTLRIDDEPILLRCAATRPDVLVVIDETIWRHAPVAGGLAPGAVLIFNSPLDPGALATELGEAVHAGRWTVKTVNATEIALEALGKPITNTAMMGAFAGATGLVSLDAIEATLLERFGPAAKANIEAARAGFLRGEA